MKIILAPDSFKGSLSSPDVCEAMSKGIRQVIPEAEIEMVPLADGGEGTVDALVRGTGGSFLQTEVEGPLKEPVMATWGMLGDGETAIIEMAEASGLTKVRGDQLNPLKASTYGTGRLMKAALDRGCKKILLGIGGSATNDGGTGMAKALGVRFTDEDGHDLPPGGGSLKQLAYIDTSGLDRRLKDTDIQVACDVTNPLCGQSGASAIFGPQKGATPEMVKTLDEALFHYATKVKEQTGAHILDVPGSGAAGGLGGGLIAFAGGKLIPGIEMVLGITRFEEKLTGADLVITGEGKTDNQTSYGKAPMGAAMKAKAKGVPVICLSGSLAKGYEKLYDYGIHSCFSIMNSPKPLEEAMKEADILLEDSVKNIIRLWKEANRT